MASCNISDTPTIGGTDKAWPRNHQQEVLNKSSKRQIFKFEKFGILIIVKKKITSTVLLLY